MDNGRQVPISRREPTIVQTSIADIIIHPLPWRKRNDLGDFNITAYAAALNQSLQSVRDEEGRIKYDAKLMENMFDWDGFLERAFAGSIPVEIEQLSWQEFLDVIKGVLEANGLEQQAYMFDPNFLSPEPSTTNDSEAIEDGPKIVSLPSSGLADNLDQV